MNFGHFCEFWCFSLGKQARFTLNFCSGMPLRKVHESTFLEFGLPGPLLINSNYRYRITLPEELICITETDLWEFQQKISHYRYRFSLEFQFIYFREAPVRFGSVTVWGWNGSSGSGFRFRRFLCKKGFSVSQYNLTGKDGSGSGFGSWKTVPVPLSVSGKTVPTVPVSGSGSVPEPPCYFHYRYRLRAQSELILSSFRLQRYLNPFWVNIRGLLRNQEKGVLAKGVSVESSATAKNNKNTPKCWAWQYFRHSERRSQGRPPFLGS